MVEELGLIVNAGGASRRMGQNKALLSTPPDDLPLVAHIIARLAPLISSYTVVVSDDPAVAAIARALPNTLVVGDRWMHGGALGGVASGLAKCTGWAMVVACDMPLVDAAIFVRLLAWAKEATEDIEAIIPRIGGQAQPFHGLWHVRALPQMVAQIEMGELRLQSALARLRVCWPDEDALGVAADSPAFVNVNTPEEWARVRALLAQCDKPTT